MNIYNYYNPIKIDNIVDIYMGQESYYSKLTDLIFTINSINEIVKNIMGRFIFQIANILNTKIMLVDEYEFKEFIDDVFILPENNGNLIQSSETADFRQHNITSESMYINAQDGSATTIYSDNFLADIKKQVVFSSWISNGI